MFTPIWDTQCPNKQAGMPIQSQVAEPCFLWIISHPFCHHDIWGETRECEHHGLAHGDWSGRDCFHYSQVSHCGVYRLVTALCDVIYYVCSSLYIFPVVQVLWREGGSIGLFHEPPARKYLCGSWYKGDSQVTSAFLVSYQTGDLLCESIKTNSLYKSVCGQLCNIDVLNILCCRFDSGQ